MQSAYGQECVPWSEKAPLQPQISNWNLSRRPCRDCVTTKLLLMLLLTELHCLLYSSTVTCPVNGQWRDCASPTSKSTVFVRTILGSGLRKEHSEALTLVIPQAEVNPAYIADLLRISEPLLRHWRTCLPSSSKDTHRVPSYLKSS